MVGMPTRLRVALIGLGDIAAKAYLPVLAADGGVEPVIVTRNPQTRDRLRSAWRIDDAYPTLADALAGPPLAAAFVHAATVAHPTIAHELVDAGVPAFVDKPLALSEPDARSVVEHARTDRVTLQVLFNRRFAPAYAELAGWDGLDTVVLTKNRVDQADDPRTFIFDDYVHVVDTLRFLVTPEPDDLGVVARRTPDGRLARIAITLRQGSRLGVGIMDRDSGQTVEVLEALAPGRTRRVTDLVEVVQTSGNRSHRAQPSNWASVSQQRGFVAMIDHCLGAVRAGTLLDAGDALASHALCEELVARVTGEGPHSG
jgi:virulence factor